MEEYHTYMVDCLDVPAAQLPAYWQRALDKALDMEEELAEIEEARKREREYKAAQEAARAAYVAKQNAFREAAAASKDAVAFWTEAFAGAKTVPARCDIFFSAMEMPAAFAAAPALRKLLEAQIKAAYEDVAFTHSALSVLDELECFLKDTLPARKGYKR